MNTLFNFVWRVRVFFCLAHGHLRFWPVAQVWGISGAILDANRDMFGDSLPSPTEAVYEELSCWSE
jgi:hypothetical protein